MKKLDYAQGGVRKSGPSSVLAYIGVLLKYLLGARLWLEIQTSLLFSLFQIRYTESEFC